MSAQSLGLPDLLTPSPETAAPERAVVARRRPVLAALLCCCGWLGVVAVGLLVAAILVLAVGPRFLPYQTYIVLTGSMSPTLPVGTVLILEPVPVEQLAVGDVITFGHPDRFNDVVTHRIVALTDNSQGRIIESKGDANPLPDSWKLIGRGTAWRLSFAIPYLGLLLLKLQHPLVREALLVIPLLWLGFGLLRDIWRPAPREARA